MVKTKRFTIKNLAILSGVVVATVISISAPRYINAKELTEFLQARGCVDVTSNVIGGGLVDRNFSKLYQCPPGGEFVPVPKILF